MVKIQNTRQLSRNIQDGMMHISHEKDGTSRTGLVTTARLVSPPANSGSKAKIPKPYTRLVSCKTKSKYTPYNERNKRVSPGYDIVRAPAKALVTIVMVDNPW